MQRFRSGIFSLSARAFDVHRKNEQFGITSRPTSPILETPGWSLLDKAPGFTISPHVHCSFQGSALLNRGARRRARSCGFVETPLSVTGSAPRDVSGLVILPSGIVAADLLSSAALSHLTSTAMTCLVDTSKCMQHRSPLLTQDSGTIFMPVLPYPVLGAPPSRKTHFPWLLSMLPKRHRKAMRRVATAAAGRYALLDDMNAMRQLACGRSQLRFYLRLQRGCGTASSEHVVPAIEEVLEGANVPIVGMTWKRAPTPRSAAYPPNVQRLELVVFGGGGAASARLMCALRPPLGLAAPIVGDVDYNLYPFKTPPWAINYYRYMTFMREKMGKGSTEAIGAMVRPAPPAAETSSADLVDSTVASLSRRYVAQSSDLSQTASTDAADSTDSADLEDAFDLSADGAYCASAVPSLSGTADPVVPDYEVQEQSRVSWIFPMGTARAVLVPTGSCRLMLHVHTVVFPDFSELDACSRYTTNSTAWCGPNYRTTPEAKNIYTCFMRLLTLLRGSLRFTDVMANVLQGSVSVPNTLEDAAALVPAALVLAAAGQVAPSPLSQCLRPSVHFSAPLTSSKEDVDDADAATMTQFTLPGLDAGSFGQQSLPFLMIRSNAPF